MQEIFLEFWSPAPLPEGDAGKDAAAPANLKKPEAADLEVSSDSPPTDKPDDASRSAASGSFRLAGAAASFPASPSGRGAGH